MATQTGTKTVTLLIPTEGPGWALAEFMADDVPQADALVQLARVLKVSARRLELVAAGIGERPVRIRIAAGLIRVTGDAEFTGRLVKAGLAEPHSEE